MNDYDYCDVLIDPSSLDAEKLIGKEFPGAFPCGTEKRE